MDIVRVRYFLAVCEHGSFTKAAKVCGVSQPSVTTGVRRLERAIGGRLFERRHPVQLTSLGAELRPLLHELQSVADRVAAVVANRRGDGALARAAKAGVLGRGAHRGGIRVQDSWDDEVSQTSDTRPSAPTDLFDHWADLLRRSKAAVSRARRASETFQSLMKRTDDQASRIAYDEVEGERDERKAH